jgi:hypothetical protein
MYDTLCHYLFNPPFVCYTYLLNPLIWHRGWTSHYSMELESSQKGTAEEIQVGVCMYVCVCVCVYVCVCMYVCMCMCVCVCMYVCILMCLYVFMYVCMCVC